LVTAPSEEPFWRCILREAVYHESIFLLTFVHRFDGLAWQVHLDSHRCKKCLFLVRRSFQSRILPGPKVLSAVDLKRTNTKEHCLR